MTTINRETMLSAFPKSSAVFDDAVDAALRQIHNQAALEESLARRLRMRRVLGWALAGALLLAGAFGIAEGIRLGVFDFLLGREDVLPQATELVQQDLTEMRVGHTTLRVTEAVYDGAMVRFVMSVQNDTVKRPITEQEAYGDGDFGAALSADGVTALYSFDWFTLGGTEYGMTGGSGGETVVGANDGEALIYFELLLSEDDSLTAPTSDFTLGVPVRTADTQEAQQMFIPVKVIAANLLRSIAPDAPVTFGEGDAAYTVTVTDAKLSPIRNAVELRVDVPGTMDENAAWDCISPWYAIALVDENGAEVGQATTSYYGLPTDETDDARHFMIRIESTPMASYPNALFVAPMGYGENGEWRADMNCAIKLNTEEK
ncbi:MAG: hypothetical protein PHY12_00855 [Eubacteriales bacterium]|nr:hypothetical protein [Eubacteriales bacterium]